MLITVENEKKRENNKSVFLKFRQALTEKLNIAAIGTEIEWQISGFIPIHSCKKTNMPTSKDEANAPMKMQAKNLFSAIPSKKFACESVRFNSVFFKI